jgi:chromosome partitioning protein
VGWGSSLSFVDIHSLERTVYDALTDPDVSLSEVIQKADNVPHLEVAPSSIALAKIEAKLLGELDSYFRLKDELKRIRRRYEFVIIDTPPALGIITVNALVAATHVLIPVQASYFALEGTDDLLETIDKIKMRANPRLQILGALLTLFDKRTRLSKDIRDQVSQVFGGKLFDTVISKSVRLEESPAYRESIFSFAPRSSGAFQYYKLSEEILGRV